MKQCLRIKIIGKVQDSTYRNFAQKHARLLGIEGTIQANESGGVIIHACGPSEKLDRLIDFLYKGTSSSQVEDLVVEPFINEKDFRGVFRIIGD